MDKDPYETRNIIREKPEIAKKLSAYINDKMKAPELVMKDIEELIENKEIISMCRQEAKEEWKVTEGLAEEAPVPMVASKVQISFGK